MSDYYSWRSSLLKSDLTSSEKLVGVIIHSYANPHGGGAFPSQETISGDASLSRQHVNKCISTLIERGFLTKTKHGFGGQKWKRNEYNLDNSFENKVVVTDNKRLSSSVQKVVASDDTNSTVNNPSNIKNKQKDLLEVEFAEFWSAYVSPHKKQVKHKGGRKTALSAYKKAIKVDNHKTIMAGLSTYLKELRKDEFVGYCNAATWLNQERWDRFESEPEQPVNQKATPELWEFEVKRFCHGGVWGLDVPNPESPNCPAPKEILTKWGYGE